MDIAPPVESTYIEKPAAAGRERHYRERHAALAGAGSFVRLIAEGGMGAVLLVEGAELPGGGRSGRCALKLLKRQHLADPEAAARLRRELGSHERLGRELQVPRLMPCLAFRDDPDPARVYGLFPFYPEGTLADLLARRGAPADAVWLLAEAVEGLQSLHGHGYVHRDLHPANVFGEREGQRDRGVLGDLGVGMFLTANTLISTTEVERERESRVGHPGYVDPWDQASPAADLYAVGATLYRILAGRDPARCPDAPALRLPRAATQQTLAPADRERADRLLEGLTAREVAARLSSAREARMELAALAAALERGPRVVVRKVVGEPAAGGGSRRAGFAWSTEVVLLAASLAVGVGAGVAARGWGAAEGQLRNAVVAAAQVKTQRGPELPAGAPAAPDQGRRETTMAREEPSAEANEGPIVSPTPTARPAARSVPAPQPISPKRTSPPSASKTLPPIEATRWKAPVSPEPATQLTAVDAALRRGEEDRAEAMLRAGLADSPESPDLTLRLALLVARRGGTEAEATRERLRAVLAAQPERGDLRLGLARLLADAGSGAEARAVAADTPPGTTHAGELQALHVTLARLAARNE